MASRVMTSGVGRSGSPRPRLMLPGFARSEIFRIMLFSMPRRNGGGWNWFKGGDPICNLASVFPFVANVTEFHNFSFIWILALGRAARPLLNIDFQEVSR